MNDNIYAHKFYQRAARGVIKIFLSIYDCPNVNGSDADDVDLSHLPPAERKKEKARLRKLKKKESDVEEARAKQLEDEAKEKRANAKYGDAKPITAPKDDDPKGEKLLAMNPLEEAAKWCLAVYRTPGCDVETFVLVAEVMLRRKKYVACLRSIVQGLKKSPSNPALSVVLVKLALAFIGQPADAAQSPANNVISAELTALLGGSLDVPTYVSQLLDRAAGSTVAHRNAAVRCVVLLGRPSASLEKAVALLTDESLLQGMGVDLQSLIDTHKVSTVNNNLFYFTTLLILLILLNFIDFGR